MTVQREELQALSEAAKPFASGGEWGAWLSWLINGAPDRAKGLAAAKQIVKWRAEIDKALLSPGGGDRTETGASPAGYVLVPREPTDAMLLAARKAGVGPYTSSALWDGMLSAAPHP